MRLQITRISLVKRWRPNRFSGRYGWWAEAFFLCIAGWSEKQEISCNNYRVYWAKEPLRQEIIKLEKKVRELNKWQMKLKG